jgi:hypothetical protein
VAGYDLRYFTAAAAYQMSVYASSAFLGRNVLRANIMIMIAPQACHFQIF